MRANRTFIILSSIFLSIAFLALMFEFYTNYECMRVLYQASQEEKRNLGTAIGQAISVGLTYVLTIFTGVIAVGFSIPVIPFSAVMLKREKNAPYAIVFLIFATIFLVVAIGMMFVVPLQNTGGSSSSYYSSAQPTSY